MKIELKKIDISIKEKLNWREVLEYENVLNDINKQGKDTHVLDLVENIAENFIISVDLKSELPQTFSDKLTIAKILNNIEYTTYDDLININNKFFDFIAKKKL